MIAKIGETAGRVWRTLDEEGELRLAALKKQIDVSDALLYMAVGWLAREDKLEVEAEGRSYRLRLK
jgi:hypothetical protein